MIQNHQKFDCVIIGAGMAGLASAIRLLMFQKKVLIVEKHSISGGLNSYYKRGKREFDVGLHALTNTIKAGEKGKPFHKLLKQLRIPLEEFQLSPQRYSLIQFPSHKLKFTNNFNDLIDSIHQNFPQEIDGFLKLTEQIKNFNEVALDNKTFMAKDVVKKYIKNQTLVEMIMAPLLIYGSAWENDMDFSQFVIMFKSIYFEGFSRPKGGVRTIINLLLKKIETLGGEVQFKKEITQIHHTDGKVTGVTINHDTYIETAQVLSTIGHGETLKLTDENKKRDLNKLAGPLSFCESIFITKEKPMDLGLDATIIFYNNNEVYHYQKPNTLFDSKSAVLCFPNNFLEDTLEEGWLRVTSMANFDLWQNEFNDRKNYLLKKDQVAEENLKLLKAVLPNFQGKYEFKDVFSPTTILRYTGHMNGAVYGSEEKIRDGRFSDIHGLFLAGTDQGFLGIVGAMLSGISMSNLHILQGGNE